MKVIEQHVKADIIITGLDKVSMAGEYGWADSTSSSIDFVSMESAKDNLSKMLSDVRFVPQNNDACNEVHIPNALSDIEVVKRILNSVPNTSIDTDQIISVTYSSTIFISIELSNSYTVEFGE